MTNDDYPRVGKYEYPKVAEHRSRMLTPFSDMSVPAYVVQDTFYFLHNYDPANPLEVRKIPDLDSVRNEAEDKSKKLGISLGETVAELCEQIEDDEAKFVLDRIGLKKRSDIARIFPFNIETVDKVCTRYDIK